MKIMGETISKVINTRLSIAMLLKQTLRLVVLSDKLNFLKKRFKYN